LTKGSGGGAGAAAATARGLSDSSASKRENRGGKISDVVGRLERLAVQLEEEKEKKSIDPGNVNSNRALFNVLERQQKEIMNLRTTITSSSSSSSSSIMQVQYSTFAEELHHRILFITRALFFSTSAQARVAICLQGSRLWYNIETAILMRRAVSAGLPDSWASSEILQVAHRANVHTLFIGAEVMKSKGLSTDKLTEAIPSLRLIVIVDDDAVDRVED
jgi:long-subunit acyl-CoA synthetase (AMP-forming)